MKYIILEDEPYAQEHLKSMIKRLRPNWELDFSADSVEDTMAYFREGNRPDICFCDIELSDGNVFKVINRYASEIPVIFITAYSTYCMDAFKANGVGYVLKPIMEEEVEDAIVKFERTQGQRVEPAPEPDDKTKDAPQRVLISSGDSYSFVEMDRVAWFMSEDKYVFVITTSGECLMTAFKSLAEVEDILDPQRFFKLSRNLVCAIESVRKINRYFKGRLKVILKAGEREEECYVSAARRADFLAWVGAGS